MAYHYRRGLCGENRRCAIGARGKRDAAIEDSRLLKRADVRRILGVGSDMFRKWLEAGILPAPRMIDGRAYWELAEIRAWIKAQPRRGEAAA